MVGIDIMEIRHNMPKRDRVPKCRTNPAPVSLPISSPSRFLIPNTIYISIPDTIYLKVPIKVCIVVRVYKGISYFVFIFIHPSNPGKIDITSKIYIYILRYRYIDVSYLKTQVEPRMSRLTYPLTSFGNPA